MDDHSITDTRHGPVHALSGLGFQRGEVVVITGAGSGIGQACAVFAARAGLEVHAWDLRRDSLEDTAGQVESTGGRITLSVIDVTDARAVAAGWDAAAAS